MVKKKVAITFEIINNCSQASEFVDEVFKWGYDVLKTFSLSDAHSNGVSH